MSQISGISLAKIAKTSAPVSSETTVQHPLGTGFADMVKEFIADTNQAQQDAEKAVKDLIAGKTEHLHETVIAMTKAEMSFRYMMEVRNKLLQAYQEIQRMQV